VPLIAVFGFVLVLILGSPCAALAQDDDQRAVAPPATPSIGQLFDLPQDSAPPPTPAHTGIHALFANLIDDFKHLPSRENAGWTLFGSALALSVHPFDARVNRHLVGKRSVHNFFVPGKIIGQGYIQVASSLGTYTVGRLAHKPKVSHVGMDLLRAQAVVGVLTYALKLTVHRERPNRSNSQSFPSGHASVTFATATVIQRHLGWEWSMPVFLVASYTSISRLHENVHYLSDVVAGATCGIIAGRTVTRHGRSVYALVPIWSHGEVALLVQRQF
jgi:membrane-associated phospholipid phosphatase